MHEKWTGRLLWLIYLALLAVLLPHTAWAFGQFEAEGSGWGRAVAWAAAFVFEAGIAALTHKLSKRLEVTPRYSSGVVWARKLWFRYGNGYAIGLILAILVSVAANMAHAVEFGRAFAIFAYGSALPGLYSAAFGGILPVVSLLFAVVLSNEGETEGAANPELEAAKGTIKDIRRQLREAERRADDAETRFGAAGICSPGCSPRKSATESSPRASSGPPCPIRRLPSWPNQARVTFLRC